MAPAFDPPLEVLDDVDVDAIGTHVVVGHWVQVLLDSTQLSLLLQLQTGSVSQVTQLRKVRCEENSRRTCVLLVNEL